MILQNPSRDKSINLIDSLAERISDPNDRHFYHDIYFHKRIKEYLEKAETVVDEKPLETASVFAFCPGCGFKNENKFAFCPSCGQDLTM